MTWTRGRGSAAVASAALLLALPLSGVAGASAWDAPNAANAPNASYGQRASHASAAGDAAGAPGILLPDGCSAGAPAQLDKPALRCLAETARSSRSGAVVVTLTRPLGLVGVDAGDVRDAREAFAEGRFAVVLPSGDSGVGGSLLFTLAADPAGRVVARDSAVARLDPGTVALLKSAGGCEAVCELLEKAPAEGVSGERLVAERLAQENGGLLMLPTRGTDGGDEGVPSWTLALPVLVLAVVLALAVPFRRRLAAQRAYGGEVNAYPGGAATVTATATAPPPPRTSAPPRPAAAATGGRRPSRGGARGVGPTRAATVRTSLHPQGYVELDRCLVRATWADAGEPPAVGESVDTVAAESGALLAVRPTRRGKN
ncbi:hypothetical protein [Streptodolium elevatio]|uniref:Uncharacterized protein n=1 Tax=Streptodolium elevatio TaxID=3157996 RepID=A0ABV3D8T8_9ACTN